MARVELVAVRKVYAGGVEAVKGVDVVIEDREFMVLVGPSGCGKSTTLRMVAGLEEVTAGEIHIDGKMVNNVAPKDRDIAMVFQNYALYPHMTVYQNMEFGLKLRRYPKAEREARVREAAATLGIDHLLDRRPKALSGGQRQRVAVGRAIVRNPKVFLFDEPLSNLDAKLRVQMRAEISKLHRRLESTMIYVTHDQVEAMTMGNRIVVMHEGLVQQVDTPMNLYHRPANRFVASFIGSPAMNLLEVEVVAEEGLRVRDKAGAIDLTVPEKRAAVLEKYVGKKVTLGLRPEDLSENVAQEASVGQSIVAPLEVVEPMGGEAVLYMNADGQAIVARLRTDEAPRVAERFVIDVDMSRAHFFDAATEKRISE